MKLNRKELISKIENWQNPYPKDIFEWNNQNSLEFNRGQFNYFIFRVVENTRNSIIKIIEEEMECEQKQ